MCTPGGVLYVPVYGTVRLVIEASLLSGALVVDLQALEALVRGGTMGGSWSAIGGQAFQVLHVQLQQGFDTYSAKKQRRANQVTSNARPDVVAIAIPLMASLLRRPPSGAQVRWGYVRVLWLCNVSTGGVGSGRRWMWRWRRTHGYMDAWIHGWMDEWMDGYMGGWMDGSFHGWVHE